MLYTTIPIPKSQQPSIDFKDRGVGHEAPCPVGESRISILSVGRTIRTITLFNYVWLFVATHLTNTVLAASKRLVNGLTSTVPAIFIGLPPLVVTVNMGLKSDEKKRILADLGFTARSSGKYKYFQGASSDPNVIALLGIQADANAYAPYGTINISGYGCFGILARIINSSLGYLSQFSEKTEIDISAAYKTSTDLWKSFAITGKDNVPNGGILFPYFDGMVLPDKAFTPRFFISTFGNMLGDTPGKLKTACETIQSGWPSLSTTAAGLQISHLAFGMDLAIRANIMIRPVIINGAYTGFVLTGSNFICFKGAVSYKPSSQADLEEEIGRLDEHNDALRDLTVILNGLDMIDKTKKVEVLSEHLASYRHIHYLLKVRKVMQTSTIVDSSIITRDVQSEISRLVTKLHFRQTAYGISDKVRIAEVFSAIAAGEWLPVSAPFFIHSGALFSRDPILSGLAAFGLKAPSLSGPTGGSFSIAVTKGGKFYEQLPKGVVLEGIPIFAKPVSQAAADFADIIRTGNIVFKTGIKDKKGFTRVGGVTTYIPVGDAHYKNVVDVLINNVKKRKERGSLNEGDETEEIPSAKRLKKSEKEGGNLLALFTPQTGVEASEPGWGEGEDMAVEDLFA